MKKLIIASTSAGALALGLGACGNSEDSATYSPSVVSAPTSTTHVAPTHSSSKTSKRVSRGTERVQVQPQKPASSTFSPKTPLRTSKPTSAVTQRSTALPTRVPAPSQTKRVSRSEVRRVVPTKTAVKPVAPKTYAPKPTQTKTVVPVKKKQIVTPKPTANTSQPKTANGSRWDSIASCESGGNSRIISSNGLYGGLYQIDRASTWGAYGGTAYAPSPEMATPAQQLAIAQKIQASQGWNAWPVCQRR